MPLLETLGGALFGAVLQLLLDKLDSQQILDYFGGTKLDGRLLKKLKRKLMDINAVIDDAEQKQFTNSLVKQWLHEVRDALYDAEDLLDQIDYEFSKTQLKAEFQSSASKGTWKMVKGRSVKVVAPVLHSVVGSNLGFIELLDDEKRKQLDWKLRLCIINGIARGLLYFHEDSRLRIIHRDLKASNLDWQGHLKLDRTKQIQSE